MNYSDKPAYNPSIVYTNGSVLNIRAEKDQNYFLCQVKKYRDI